MEWWHISSSSFSFYLCLDCPGCLFSSCNLQSVLISTSFASLVINLSSPSPSSSSSSCCWYSLFLAVTTPRKLLHSILFAALVFRLLTRTSNLAGLSVLTPPGLHLSQFLDNLCRVKESFPSPATDWSIRPPCLCHPYPWWSICTSATGYPC